MSEGEKMDLSFWDMEGGFENKKRAFKKYNWQEDTLHIEETSGRQKALPTTRTHIGSGLNSKRMQVLTICMTIFFVSLFFRVFHLQTVSGKYYRQLAEYNRERILPIYAQRGIIYDVNGIALTENIPKFSLAVTPQDLPVEASERILVVTKLSQITGLATDQINNLLTEYGSYSYESINILEDLDYETALSVQIAAADLPGISVQRGSKRNYISNTSSSTALFSHVLGYEGKLNVEELESLYPLGYLPSDSVGKSGLEKSYEHILRGVYGRKRVEVDARGRQQTVIAKEEPIPGKNLVLNLDVNVQYALDDIVNKALEENNLTRAAAVVMNAKDGGIIAMLSIPYFDNNEFSGGISYSDYQKYLDNPDNPLFNRVIGGTYPSGSTIKTALAVAALEEGVINESTTFPSTGGLAVASWFFPDWQAGGHGLTDVRKAIAWSVNTFFYYIGGGYGSFEGLGPYKVVEYFEKFGLSEKLGVDLPGEASGFLPTVEWKNQTKNEKWYIGDTYNMSIGQGDVLVTPLQIASLTATIANGGVLNRPHIAKTIIDPVTDDTIKVSPEPINSVVASRYNIGVVKQGMRDCVTYGSCRALNTLPVSTAGKTGTAQWSQNKANHAWFTSFAPYDNPEIIVTILVEEGDSGSKIAVPIARDFYSWWWSYQQRQ